MVSLFFNGISTFGGYLMPKPFLKKNSSGTIWPIAREIKEFIPFQGYSSKSECNNVTGVWTHSLWGCCPILYLLHHGDSSFDSFVFSFLSLTFFPPKLLFQFHLNSDFNTYLLAFVPPLIICFSINSNYSNSPVYTLPPIKLTFLSLYLYLT